MCVGAKPRRWLSEPPSSLSITTKVRGSWPDAMYCTHNPITNHTTHPHVIMENLGQPFSPQKRTAGLPHIP